MKSYYLLVASAIACAFSCSAPQRDSDTPQYAETSTKMQIELAQAESAEEKIEILLDYANVNLNQAEKSRAAGKDDFVAAHANAYAKLMSAVPALSKSGEIDTQYLSDVVGKKTAGHGRRIQKLIENSNEEASSALRGAMRALADVQRQIR